MDNNPIVNDIVNKKAYRAFEETHGLEISEALIAENPSLSLPERDTIAALLYEKLKHVPPVTVQKILADKTLLRTLCKEAKGLEHAQSINSSMGVGTAFTSSAREPERQSAELGAADYLEVFKGQKKERSKAEQMRMEIADNLLYIIRRGYHEDAEREFRSCRFSLQELEEAAERAGTTYESLIVASVVNVIATKRSGLRDSFLNTFYHTMLNESQDRLKARVVEELKKHFKSDRSIYSARDTLRCIDRLPAYLGIRDGEKTKLLQEAYNAMFVKEDTWLAALTYFAHADSSYSESLIHGLDNGIYQALARLMGEHRSADLQNLVVRRLSADERYNKSLSRAIVAHIVDIFGSGDAINRRIGGRPASVDFNRYQNLTSSDYFCIDTIDVSASQKAAFTRALPDIIELRCFKNLPQLLEVFDINEAYLNTTDSYDKIKKAFLGIIEAGVTIGQSLQSISSALGLDDELTKLCCKKVESLLDNNEVSSAAETYRCYRSWISEEQVTPLRERAALLMVQRIATNSIPGSSARAVTSHFQLSPKSFAVPEVRSVITGVLSSNLDFYEMATAVSAFNRHCMRENEKLTLSAAELCELTDSLKPEQLTVTLDVVSKYVDYEDSPQVKEKIGAALVRALHKVPWSEKFISLANAYGVPADVFVSEEVRSVLIAGAEKAFKEGDFDSGFYSLKFLGLDEDFEFVQPLVEANLDKACAHKSYDQIIAYAEHYNVSFEKVSAIPAVRKNALVSFDNKVSQGEFEEARELRKKYQFSDKELHKIMPKAIALFFKERFDQDRKRGYKAAQEVLRFFESMNYEGSVPFYGMAREYLNSLTTALIKTCELKTVQSFLEFASTYYEHLDWMREHGANGDTFSKADFDVLPHSGVKFNRDKLPVFAAQAYVINSECPEGTLGELHKSGDFEAVEELLKRKVGFFAKIIRTKDYEKLKQAFGTEKVLRLVYDAKLHNEHDSVVRGFLAGAVKLLNVSKKPADVIFEKILMQVAVDQGEYGIYGSTQSARKEFAKLMGCLGEGCPTLSFNIERLVTLAKDKSDIKPLAKLIDTFLEDTFPYGSWNDLKLYAAVSSVLEDSERMHEIEALEKTNKGLFDFFVAIYFSRESRINKSILDELWKRPESFLQRSPDSEMMNPDLRPLLNFLRPFNLTSYSDYSLPHLDLSPTDVRDSLFDGTLDRVQRFTPMKIRYKVPKSGKVYASVRDALSAAVGSQSQGVTGRAQKGKGRPLFTAVNGYIKQKVPGANLVKYVRGEVDLPPEVEEWIHKKVYDKDIGIQEEWHSIEASLHRKSCPIGLSAADDTASCMPLGSVKGNVYLFDPDLAFFTLRIDRGDGTYRTIAESVVSKDVPLDRDYSHIYQSMKCRGRDVISTSLYSYVKDMPDCRQGLILGCDNIQMAPNYAREGFDAVVQAVYRDFFREYVDRFASEEGLCAEKLGIGLANSEGNIGLTRVGNTHMPRNAPIGYSDRYTDKICQMQLDVPRPAVEREVLSVGDERVGSCAEDEYRTGMSALQSCDILSLAYLSGKGFTELANQKDMHQGIQALKLQLQAIELNNAHKGRANLSFMLRGDNGLALGYILAYEGRDSSGNKVVHIREIVSTKDSPPSVSYRLLQQFAQAYQEAYSEGEKPAVYMDVNHKRYEKELARISRIAGHFGINIGVEAVEITTRAQTASAMRLVAHEIG